MATIQLFRTLVVGSLLLWYAVVASHIFSASLFGQGVATVLGHNGHDAWLSVPHSIFWTVQFLWAVSAVGMYLLQKWARTLFLLLNAYSFIELVTGGLQIQTGSQAALFYLVNLADGAVLFMAYLSSIAARFTGGEPNPAVHTDAAR